MHFTLLLCFASVAMVSCGLQSGPSSGSVDSLIRQSIESTAASDLSQSAAAARYNAPQAKLECYKVSIASRRVGFHGESDADCKESPSVQGFKLVRPPTGANVGTVPADLVTCTNAVVADVCVYETAVDPYAGFWFVSTGRDPLGCDPSIEPPAYLARFCRQNIATYSIAVPGSKAKAGDTCWASPGAIGTPLISGTTNTKISNITHVVLDEPWNVLNGGYLDIGWIYYGQDGSQWFQGNPGTTVGVTVAGTLSFGVSIGQGVVRISPYSLSAFNILNNVRLQVTGAPTGSYFHSRGCFTGGWDGTYPA